MSPMHCTTNSKHKKILLWCSSWDSSKCLSLWSLVCVVACAAVGHAALLPLAVSSALLPGIPPPLLLLLPSLPAGELSWFRVQIEWLILVTYHWVFSYTEKYGECTHNLWRHVNIEYRKNFQGVNIFADRRYYVCTLEKNISDFNFTDWGKNY